MDRAELDAKLRGLVAPRLGEAGAERIAELCRGLVAAPSIRPLMAALRGRPPD
jgi:hypothetical protein